MSAVLLVTILAISGVADARGFVYAARIWRDGFAFTGMVSSGAWFSLGIGSYWMSLYFANRVGIVSAQVQVLIWLFATVVGVALLTGDFRRWPHLDRSIAVLVAVLVAILLVRRER